MDGLQGLLAMGVLLSRGAGWLAGWPPVESLDISKEHNLHLVMKLLNAVKHS